jgi:ABC-type bacteriocin/lantibiotic exporter with double-glycine peptidase domain
MQDTFTTNIAEFLRQFILIIGGISLLFYTSVKLAMIMLAVVPVVAIVAVVFGRYIRKFSKNVQDKTAESNNIVQETFQGISNVKAFANEWFEIACHKRWNFAWSIFLIHHFLFVWRHHFLDLQCC